jgi:DNA polymerase-1
LSLYKRSSCNYSLPNPHPIDTSRIVSIESCGVNEVYDLEVEEDHSYVGGFNGGIPSHNSQSPNLQNIPKDFRAMFVPRAGYTFLELDYAQLEVRITSVLSEEKKILEALDSGKDIHKITASNALGVPYEEVTPEQRQLAKTVIYATSYGAGARKIAETTGRSYQEVKSFLQKFKAAYPNFTSQLKYWSKLAEEKGFLVTPYGFVHHFTGDRIPTQAMNFIPQSTAAMLINIALVKIVNHFQYKGVHPLIQVHDSLLFEVSQDLDQEKVKEEIIEIMSSPQKEVKDYSFPVDGKYGLTWLETH